MPGIKRLSHVCLRSKDLGKTLEFYQDVLGCTVIHEFRNQEEFLYGVFLLVEDGTFLEFFHQEEPITAGGPLRHICFEVEDIQAFAKAMEEKGFHPEVKRGRTDRVLQCWVTDPDENLVEFHQYDQESVQYPYAKREAI